MKREPTIPERLRAIADEASARELAAFEAGWAGALDAVIAEIDGREARNPGVSQRSISLESAKAIVGTCRRREQD